MNVRYQIIVEVTADGMMGPLKVQDLVAHTVRALEGKHGLRIGKVRTAAVYPLAQDDEKAMVTRVPGSDQSRPVEEVRDPRIT